MKSPEFSYKTRGQNIERMQNEEFDILVIGGGITGAATARDAVSRGLKVALVEARDYAWGTSSRSSKLIHGGLRYLKNMELGLVFEALAERTHLLKSSPHRVRPLPFYTPVYQGDSVGKLVLSMGLWLYDLLALFRTPSLHKNLSKKQMLKAIPFLKEEGLKGGFCYFDASMRDDLLAIETIRSAFMGGASVANYLEAIEPLWKGDCVIGFKVRNKENLLSPPFELKAKQVIVCAGPWTDELGKQLSPQWKPWLSPSKGIHLVFDLKRISVPGAMVMGSAGDGRVSFVMSRPDLGEGVTIVGTTDAPTSRDPTQAIIDQDDVSYLMNLLNKYFPTLHLKTSDIISAYVGVRPLMGSDDGLSVKTNSKELQKVSREHYIGIGPGNTVLVAGGKYTTHRNMAKEIVDFTLKVWKKSSAHLSLKVGKSKTSSPVNPLLLADSIQACEKEASKKSLSIPLPILDRYGGASLEVLGFGGDAIKSPEGFPLLGAQLRYTMRNEMVLHLEDFYFRRVPLYLTRADHGFPWGEELAKIWAEEQGLGEKEAKEEYHRLVEEIEKRSEWKKQFNGANT